jgi:hypothetical protein
MDNYKIKTGQFAQLTEHNGIHPAANSQQQFIFWGEKMMMFDILLKFLKQAH